ncbi:hypothetical protein LSH36_713g01120 [Paralvinella palmiformis]|uniref:PiggyBac transposable element-derived protein domain-containing protein n=1 Tax=Paralvinella palmiformis TaxID=53620 RepID=A0AAD9MT98_9ANNE|nr:hypothetical protein LSH36_713g01120 [Paralvinella palmiformis]
MNQEKLKQLQAQVRIGGKGTARRKKKVIHRTATTDDKKLQSTLKKLAVNNIPGIEEKEACMCSVKLSAIFSQCFVLCWFREFLIAPVTIFYCSVSIKTAASTSTSDLSFDFAFDTDSEEEFGGFDSFDVKIAEKLVQDRRRAFDRESDDDFSISDLDRSNSESGDSSSDDETMPVAPHECDWTDNLTDYPDIPFINEASVGVDNAEDCSKMYAEQLFGIFFTDYLFRLIVGETNRYAGHRFFTDNYYTSIELMTKLEEQNTLSWGTVTQNRLGLPKDAKKTCAVVKSLKRGDSLKRMKGRMLLMYYVMFLAIWVMVLSEEETEKLSGVQAYLLHKEMNPGKSNNQFGFFLELIDGKPAQHQQGRENIVVLAVEITDLLPGILNQLGAESLTNLKKLATSVTAGVDSDNKPDAADIDEDDDDVPELVENFDEASKNEGT